MELNRWKDILIDWVLGTNFLQPTFLVLEDSDLDAFFREYRVRVKPAIEESNVYTFLKRTFPSFTFHFFDEDGICAADFVYVYSLLLQYGCVQCRDVHLQNACKQLTVHQQKAVTNFFQSFGANQNETVSRVNLRQTIKSAMIQQAADCESPNSTPLKRRSDNGTVGTPNTPRNRLLEQNMRELNRIRMQLEAERYEKGFLEIQIRDGEEQIKRLNETQRQHLTDIHELKNQLLYENDENKTPNLNQDVKEDCGALKKTICALEDKVQGLLIDTHCLETDKVTLKKKLKHSEDQMQILFERTQEMNCLIDEIKTDVQRKDQTISELYETNGQLQAMLSEYKGSTTGDLNSTSDFSFSKHSECDSDISGMNLAKSVVDVQLKEQQQENQKLMADIASLRTKTCEFQHEMEEFLKENEIQLDPDTSIQPEDDRFELLLDALLKRFNETIGQRLELAAQVTDLVRDKTTAEESCNKLTQEMAAKNIELERLSAELSAEISFKGNCEAEIGDLRSNCNSLRVSNDNLNVEIRSIQATIRTLEEDLFIKMSELKELNTKHQRELDHNQKLSYEFENSNRAIAELHSELEAQRHELETIRRDHDRLESDYKHLAEVNSSLEGDIETQKGEIAHKAQIVIDLENRMRLLKENNDLIEEVTICLNEELQVKTALMAKLEAQVEAKEVQMKELNDQLKELQANNESIVADKRKLDEEISNLRRRSSEQLTEIEIMSRNFDETTRANTDLNDKLSSINAQVQKIAQQLKITKEKEDEYNERIIALEGEVNVAAADLEKKSAEIHVLANQLSETRSLAEAQEQELNEKNYLIGDLITAKSQLQANIKEAAVEIEMEVSKAAQLQSQLDAISASKTLVEQHVIEVEEEIKESIVMLVNFENQVGDYKTKVADLERILIERDQEISTISSEMAATRIAKEKIETALQDERRAVSAAEDRVQQLTREVTESKQENLSLEQRLTAMTEDVLNKSMNISVLESEVTTIKDTIEDLAHTIAGLTEDLQDKVNQLATQEAKAQVLERNIEKYKVEIEQLTQSHENLAQSKEMLEQVHLTLKEENVQLKDSLKDKDVDVALKCNEVEGLHQQLNEVDMETAELRKEIVCLQSTVTDKMARLEQLERVVGEMQTLLDLEKEMHDDTRIELNQAANELVSLNEDINIRSIREQTLMIELADSRQDREMLTRLNENITTDFERQSKIIADLEEELQEMKVMAVDMETNISEMHEVVIEKSKLVQELNANVDQLTETRTKLQTEIRCIENELKEETSKNVSNLEQINSMKNKLNEHEAALEKVVSELKATVEQRDEAIANGKEMDIKASKLDLINAELSDTIATLNARLEVNEATAKKSEDVIRSLNGLINNQDIQISQFKLEVTDLKETTETLRSQINAHLEVQKKLTGSKSKLEAELETIVQREQVLLKGLKQSEENAEVTINALKAEVAQKDSEKEALQGKIAELNDAINAQTSDTTLLSIRIDDLVQNKEALEIEVKDLHEDKLKTQKLFDELKREECAQTDKLKAQESVIRDMCEENSRLKSDLELLKSEANEKEFNLQSELDQVIETSKRLTTTITTLSKDLSAKDDLLSRAGAEVEGLQKTVAEREEIIDTKIDEAEKKQMALLSTELEMQKLGQENVAQSNLIDKLTAENRLVECQLSACEEKLSQMAIEADALKCQVTSKNDDLAQQLEQLNDERKRLIDLIKEHELKEIELAAQVVTRDQKISLLTTDLHKNEVGQMEESSRINALLQKLEGFKTDESRLHELDKLHHREKELNKKLATDVEILHAKLQKNRKDTEEKEQLWQAEKKALVEKVNSSDRKADDRMKDYRLEMEGKLEKMKEKMKTLYNEEMGKLKGKHERDVLEMRKEVVARQKQVDEYDAHTRKLSKQIRQLNEKQLEYYKENELMKTRMRSLGGPSGGKTGARGGGGSMMSLADDLDGGHLRRRMMPPSSSMLSVANMKMEDEEGEQFNNTYLIDLKNGRIQTSPGRESVCLSELKHRNSMVPRHLRSTYAVQYGDQGYREEDLAHPIPPMSLDDSMSSLLNTGQRKKVGGTTSYKRPGPPTPSKNGGRLSFGGTGGSGRLSFGGLSYDTLGTGRDTLKEANHENGENNRNRANKNDTPIKVLGLFSSSSSKTGTPKRRLNIFRTKK